jgi:hypothetical protein
MTQTRIGNARLLVVAILFASFCSAHLIDEFLWGAPAEFHLSVPLTLLLAFVFMAALTGLIALAARGSSRAYSGLAVAGFLIALADVAKHGAEILTQNPWRSGAISVLLALGVTSCGVATGWLALVARRKQA